MKAVRWLVGRIILFLDWVFSPKTRELTVEERSKISAASAGLSIYQFESCPFCVKVRRFMKAEGISVPLVDALAEPGRTELIRGGGRHQVPCLRIEGPDGSVRWLYESDDIISYLRKNVAASA